MKKIFGLLLFFPITLVVAQTKLDKATIEEYLKVQKEFNTESCNLAVTKKFEELTLKYKGDGTFIPLLPNETIDQVAINKNAALFDEKLAWLESQKNYVKELKNFSKINDSLKRIENEMNLILEAKKDFYFSKDEKKKVKIRERAQKQFTQLLHEIETLVSVSPFLLSFKFPNNHLELRTQYDANKDSKLAQKIIEANTIYLKRRIIQDGSYDESLIRNDSSIRASFDTLYLSLTAKKDRDFLTENERSDLIFIIRNFKLLLDQGPIKFTSRFEEWIGRTQRSKAFYLGLIESVRLSDLQKKKKAKSKDQAGEAVRSALDIMLEERANSLLELKSFVLTKEGKAYQYWSSKSELFQYLYAMETILYAEVGRIDAPDALERRDVAQIVFNRAKNPKYNLISEKDAIYNYIPSVIELKNHQWLNVLFKEGEFSFTYFYIPGNFHIYCPDMSKVGQFLRRENLRIAMEIMGKPRDDFKALRYFSRMSMFGRIEMDSLWTDYVAIDETPGKKVKNPKEMYELFKANNYKFLYSFENGAQKKKYLVVEMKKKIYVVDANNTKQIFYYRNPHHFRYFSPIK